MRRGRSFVSGAADSFAAKHKAPDEMDKEFVGPVRKRDKVKAFFGRMNAPRRYFQKRAAKFGGGGNG